MNLLFPLFFGIATLPACLADAPGASGMSGQDRYRIHPGDVIEVKFRYSPEFNQTATVQPDGFVSLDLGGEVKAAGLTVPEAAAEIRKTASARLLDPDVSVSLREFIKPRITVAGEVGRPGLYDPRGGLNVTQAIALAGGFRENAKHSSVWLVRRVDDQWARVRALDMKRMMRSGGIAEDVDLRDGDMLIVPESRLGRVDRVVRWASLAVFGIAAFRP